MDVHLRYDLRRWVQDAVVPTSVDCRSSTRTSTLVLLTSSLPLYIATS